MATTSKTVQVAAGTARNVLALSLFPGEAYLLEYALDLGCCPSEANYAAYYENAVRVVLDETHNPLTLWRPGFYRLIPDGDLNERADAVVGPAFTVNIGAAINNVAVGDGGA